ncbi:hypothetical protein LOAG_15115 [Loa loa]|uniref:Uncharacterized protein n=1 Tax=Loa loa TaxID=7209 RepID=A0A1S0TGW1_LOALO|nr:hypothetical protein LOAG_15115 [Loa loa]EFO13413.2 hypothetical protein LOAG_15115 [Loa loa]
MKLILAVFDVILPISAILLAVFKVHNVSIKWYTINLLAAYCTTNIGRNINDELKSFFHFGDFTLKMIFWFATYTRLISFTLTRLILFLCILEIYSIYALEVNALKALYRRIQKYHR